MNTRSSQTFLLTLGIIALLSLAVWALPKAPRLAEREYENEQGHAAEAFEWWYGQRATNGYVDSKAYLAAFQYSRSVLASRMLSSKEFSVDTTNWHSIGPNNVGGRTLAIAIHPTQPNVIWAGAATGGLWKSTTGGVGAAAWTYVNTGFPTVSVSTIVIDPSSQNTLYIGTGEFKRYSQPGQIGTPGARATYGLGILKSTDGGTTWSQTGLNWQLQDYKSIQRIVIHPTNRQILYAATSDGVYKTTDGGNTWSQSLATPATMDIVINPFTPSVLYASCGQLNTSPNPGLYKTTNDGASWTQLSGGLPTTNFGRTALALYASPTTEIVFAGVGDASALTASLYKTTNGGMTWTLANSNNYASQQSWYDNTVAVKPTDSSKVYSAGLDIYLSTTGGTSPVQMSFWYAGYGGVVPAGGAEGPTNYVHADHHIIAFDPSNPTRMFFGCDGGIFESTDGGQTFAGRNGGYATTEFYNGFASATTDSLVAYGGLQDNGTLKFEGSLSWNKTYGGDGGWCAIDPVNKNIAYEEYVYLDISKTTDGGQTWYSAAPSVSGNSSETNFISPFVVCPSNGNVLYAGARTVYKSIDGGTSWTATNGGQLLNGTQLSCLATSWHSTDTVYAGTGTSISTPSYSTGTNQIFFTSNGGTNWINVTANYTGGLPTRFPTDLYVSPQDSRVVYLTYSGYGTPHVFKSTNAGQNWMNITANLPDIPVQSVLTDDQYPNDIYVGTDLGVYRSTDGGMSWSQFSTGMPPAMILDLSISPKNRVLRAATFGNGVYEHGLKPATGKGVPVVVKTQPLGFTLNQNYPNPFNPTTLISFTLPKTAHTTLKIYDITGRNVQTLLDEQTSAGTHQVTFNASNLASGTYLYKLTSGNLTETKKMTLVK
jgi:photosystem II stability/assembly factor-like uncharacterized protein